MPATSANLVHVDDFGSLIRKPMYCGRVQQAVVGRGVLLTFIPEKNSLLGGLSNSTGHCQCVSPISLLFPRRRESIKAHLKQVFLRYFGLLFFVSFWSGSLQGNKAYFTQNLQI